MDMMGTLIQDLRFALRSLAKRPAFTVVAVLSLALGIGANTAIFSVIDAVLLRPLPYSEPRQLVDVYESSQQMPYGSVSAPALRDWQEQNHVFSQLAAYRTSNVNLEGVLTPERLSAELASANIFTVLGVKPELGRTFLTGEDKHGAPHVVVLSDGLWRRRFGADPEIIGKPITLSGESYTVVGVMPNQFRFPATEARDLWTPLQLDPQLASQRSARWLGVIGRIKAGVRISAVDAEMHQIATRLAERYPKGQKGLGALVVPLRQDLTSDVRPTLLLLLGAAGMVLLIACANVANLLLARASDRRREVAIRLALGAGRARLIRQFLTESILLALLGGVAGVFLAYVGVKPLLRIAGAIPFASDVGFDPWVFTFLLLISVVTGVVFGLMPAIQSVHVDLQSDLKEGGDRGSAGRGLQRFRSLLVIGEIALALVLLVGAGLLMRAFTKLQNTDTGMVTHNVLTMHLPVPSQKYDSAVSTRFYQPVLQRVNAIPGVRTAGLITSLPLQESHSFAPVVIEGRPPDKAGDESIAENRVVSPGYFGALGIRTIRGRNFYDRHLANVTRELVVNQAFASKYFPNSDPIGRKLRLSDSVSAPIVGVVADVRETQLDQLSAPTMYFSFLQYQPSNMVLVISTSVPPQSITASVRAAIHAVNADQPVYLVKTMDDVVTESFSSNRFSFWLLGTFAMIALVLAAVGIYGVMSYVVTQRTREVGIRMALGAPHEAVLRLIMRHGMTLAAVGLGIGIVLALVLTRLLASLFYAAGATDPTTIVAVALLLGIVALVASYLPARRAAAVDPAIALRSE